ncbi:hypothetical protein CTU88_14715 [Streptomyces sp. JV178]|nr:hypothetical protein CTU88_14715 [Streptomyces sp. JV178]
MMAGSAWGREREVIEMSLRPRLPGEVPARTAEVARLAFPKGCLCMRIREALGPLFADEDFVELFPQRGQPAWPPQQLALVSVLQFVEGLSDRQAAAAVRGRIDWEVSSGAGVNRSWVRPFRAVRVPRPAGGRPGGAASAGAGPGAVAGGRPAGEARRSAHRFHACPGRGAPTEPGGEHRGTPAQCPERAGRRGRRLAAANGAGQLVRPLPATHRGLF